MQEKADANMRNKEEMLARLEAKIETKKEEVDAMQLKANPVETEATVERQEIPSEEAAVHSIRAWQKETMACQETTEARLEFKEPTSEDTEPETEHKEKMDTRMAEMKDEQKETMACQEMTEACQDSKELSPEEMESQSESREVPTEEAGMKSSRTMKKRHTDRRIAAGRRRTQKELTRGNFESRRKLAAACRKVSRRATVA
jgi:hypothetical protein